jgi:internalin A
VSYDNIKIWETRNEKKISELLPVTIQPLTITPPPSGQTSQSTESATTTTTTSGSGQTVTTEKPERKVLEGIPSPSQGDTSWCAWYSAQMVLDYYGYDVAPEAIAARTFDLAGRSWNGESLPMDLFGSYGNAIVALSDDNLQTKELTSRNRDVLLNDLIEEINKGNPVIVASNGAWLFDLSSGTWLYDDLKYLKWPDGGHASVIVGYSLTNEGLVKELPILGVSPPAIRIHDSATSSIGIGTYWLSFNDFFNKVTADNSWLRLLVIQRNAEATTTRQEASGVVFPDPNLEAAIRVAINKPEGAIYAADLEGLTSLHANQSEIKDITGLEYCVNLQDLDLMNNQITDLSSLSGLTSLQTLNLRNNQITDLSPLSGLTGLQELNLWSNQITDLSPLSGLTGLQELILVSNQITDLSPLSGLTGLQELSLWSNQITDLSPLSGLTGLQELYLSGTKITDLSPL